MLNNKIIMLNYSVINILLFKDVNLCSHIWSVCYLAQSIFEGHEVIAEPCNRKCPSGISLIPRRPKSRIRHNNGRSGINYGIPMGQRTPTRFT